MSVLQATKACEDALQDRLNYIGERATTDALIDIGTVAELTNLVLDEPLFVTSRSIIAEATMGWLRTGLLEHIMMSAGHHLYHCTLLLVNAARVGVLTNQEITTVSTLTSHAMIGRSELPTLTMYAIASNLGQSGVTVELPRFPAAASRAAIDKRALRARSDENDIAALLMVCNLASDNALAAKDLPQLLPRIMLIQSLRAENANWIAILALLVRECFGAPQPVQAAALAWLTANIEPSEHLLPVPAATQLESEFFERAPTGLRMRSTLAYCRLIEGTSQ